jgi:hypothetical protein
MLGFGTGKKTLPGVALTLRTPDGREKVVTREGAPVAMIGEVGELTLYMNGRKGAAIVTFEGDDSAIEVVKNAKFGV